MKIDGEKYLKIWKYLDLYYKRKLMIMEKIYIKNGLKYSRYSFEDYKFRVIVIFLKDNQERSLDIYTTDTDKESFKQVIISKMKEGVEFIEIDHWCSKETDDALTQWLDEQDF